MLQIYFLCKLSIESEHYYFSLQQLFEPQTPLLRYVLEQPYSRDMVCNILSLNKQVGHLTFISQVDGSLWKKMKEGFGEAPAYLS